MALPPGARKPSAFAGGDLGLRVVSAIVLGALAIGCTIWGGWPFALLWAAAAALVLWEWTRIVGLPNGHLAVGGIGLLIALVALQTGAPLMGMASVALAAIAGAALAPAGQRNLAGVGVLYAGVLLVAPVLLRGDPDWGLLAIVFLFAVVWSTDIGGYFAGRLLGGPKLMPAVSPKKTWSGALGGSLGAMAAAGIASAATGGTYATPLMAVALVLSIASQAGDLAESGLKRAFDVKDSSHLIPGHGGLMDRLDGFVVAAFFALLIGLARGGWAQPGRGLLAW